VGALAGTAHTTPSLKPAAPLVGAVNQLWHLVKHGDDIVTKVRQRFARERRGRRGRLIDPAWAHRRTLLPAGDRLSHTQLDRLARMLAEDDPTNEIGAWAPRPRCSDPSPRAWCRPPASAGCSRAGSNSTGRSRS